MAGNLRKSLSLLWTTALFSIANFTHVRKLLTYVRIFVIFCLRGSMNTTATDLRTHLYTWLDRVATTGEVLEVERKGTILRISREHPVSRLALLPKRPTMLVEPQSIVDQGWSDAWKAEL